MTPELWNIISVVIAFLFMFFIGIIGWFIRNSWYDLKQSIIEIKAQLTMLAEQKDFEKLRTDVDDHHDRIVKLEATCKMCKK